MNTDENKRLVTSALERLAEKCRLNRALTLTESDLKCQLYLELFQIPQFGTLNEIFDQGILGPSIHTETKFFEKHALTVQVIHVVSF